MNDYLLTLPASDDILEIWSHIARDSVVEADRVEQAIVDACRFLARSRFSGHLRNDLTRRAVRFWNLTRYTNYMIFYRYDTNPIEVLGVVHGMRNLEKIVARRLRD